MDRLDQLILVCLSHYIALYGQKERLYMSDKLYTFKEREWVVTGWAEGQMETDRTDDNGNPVMQPYYQLFVLSPVSSYKSDNYNANGLKAEKLRCVSNAVWKDLTRREVAPPGVTPPLTGGHYLQDSRLGGQLWKERRTSFFMTGCHSQARHIPRNS